MKPAKNGLFINRGLLSYLVKREAYLARGGHSGKILFVGGNQFLVYCIMGEMCLVQGDRKA